MTHCPFCSAVQGHPGQEYCPATGQRLPTLSPADRISEPHRETESATPSSQPGGIQNSNGDPYADYEQEWQIRFVWGDVLGLEEGAAILIGRDPASPVASHCGVNISSRHAEVTVRDDYAWIQDLGSTNGTFVNEEQVEASKPRMCVPGDTVRLAKGSDKAPALSFEIVKLS